MRKKEVFHSKRDTLGGTPVFVGTRVPIASLLDYLAGGRPLDEFLDDFPTVTRKQAIALLQSAKDALLNTAYANPIG